MRVAVTGASGHIGTAVCRTLLEHGYDVTALCYNELYGVRDQPLKIVKGDIRAPESLNELMKGCDFVIHTAATISLGYKFNKSVYSINVEGTKNVLDAAKKANIKRVVHFSSIHAFSHKPHDQPLDETRSFVDDHSIFYDQTKRDGHLLALRYAREGMNVVIVCPTSAVGPPDYRPSKLGKAIVDIYRGYVPAVVKGGFDFADVRDMASGTLAAMEKGRSAETYILGGNYYTIKQFADIILEEKGSKKRMRELPLAIADFALPFVKAYAYLSGKEPLYDRTYLDILRDGNKKVLSVKAMTELGYTVRDLRETLADTVRWFRNAGRI